MKRILAYLIILSSIAMAWMVASVSLSMDTHAGFSATASAISQSDRSVSFNGISKDFTISQTGINVTSALRAQTTFNRTTGPCMSSVISKFPFFSGRVLSHKSFQIISGEAIYLSAGILRI